MKKIENYKKSLKLIFNTIPEHIFSFFVIWHGAKHSPLVLGVWMTEGRILGLQRKLVILGHDFSKFKRFHENPAPECETTSYKLQFDGVVALRLWNFLQKLFHRSFYMRSKMTKNENFRKFNKIIKTHF